MKNTHPAASGSGDSLNPSQESLFARAKRGTLPDVLSLADVVRLSLCSAENPSGLGNDNRLSSSLRTLIECGLVVPIRSVEVKVPTLRLFYVIDLSPNGRPPAKPPTPSRKGAAHYVHRDALRPYLSDLGSVGPYLREWLGDVSSAEKQPKSHRGGGKESQEVGRAIKRALAALEKGGLALGDIHRCTVTEWLIANVVELSQVIPDSLAKHLKEKGHVTECMTGRCGKAEKATELAALSQAWASALAAEPQPSGLVERQTLKLASSK